MPVARDIYKIDTVLCSSPRSDHGDDIKIRMNFLLKKKGGELTVSALSGVKMSQFLDSLNFQNFRQENCL